MKEITMKVPILQRRMPLKPPAKSFELCATCAGPTTEADPVIELVADADEKLLDPRYPDTSPSHITATHQTELRMRKCAACRRLEDRGRELADEHPFLSDRLGYREHAAHRFAQALTALDVVGQTASFEAILAGGTGRRAAALLVDAKLGLADLGAAAGFAGWLAPTLSLWGKHIINQPAKRWQHVDDAERQQIVEAASRFRLLLTEHEVEVPVPEGGLRGCMLCGIGTVTASSVAAHDRAVWEAFGRSSSELANRPQPELQGSRITGWLCPTCQKTARNAQGNFVAGHGLVEEAFWAWGGLPKAQQPDALDHLSKDKTVRAALTAIKRVKAWAVTPGARDGQPNAAPWGHVPESILDALGIRRDVEAAADEDADPQTELVWDGEQVRPGPQRERRERAPRQVEVVKPEPERARLWNPKDGARAQKPTPGTPLSSLPTTTVWPAPEPVHR
jgi:hypothetical protein